MLGIYGNIGCPQNFLEVFTKSILRDLRPNFSQNLQKKFLYRYLIRRLKQGKEHTEAYQRLFSN